jgi:hypothetical protein
MKLFMKTTRWLALVAAVTFPLLSVHAQAPAVGAAHFSPNAAEVIKLAGSGVGDEVVLAYIQNAQAPFNLSADNVLHLRNMGVSQPVITAMLNHDSAMHSQEPAAPPPHYAPSAPPAPQVPPPQPVAAPVAYVSSPPADVGYFYNDLAPYGSWASLPGVGWCWQPAVVVVNRAWRPYCDAGHWVYTDAGWFWQSEYPWGWAAFHYGRWYLDPRCGWVWVPGRVWGPAWVTWRTVGTTCGWAPLPPGAEFVAGTGWRWRGVTVGASFDFGLGVNAFAFVSFGNFCAPNVAVHCLPHSHATAIFRQTTIVNNYTVVKNTYVNNGVSMHRIAAASHKPVPRASLHDAPGGFGKPPSTTTGGIVYRSQLRAPEKPARMVAQKVDVAHPMIRHDSEAMRRYQQKPSSNGGGPGSSSQHTPGPVPRAEPSSSSGRTKPAPAWQRRDPNVLSSPKSGSTPAPGAQGAFGKNPSSPGQEGSKGTTRTYGPTGQGQPAAGPTTPQTRSVRFYNPKTVEQASQVRSIYQQPKASSSGTTGSGSEPGSKKNQ